MKSMELDKLQALWKTLDQKLDRNWQLNLELIRKTNLDKARRKMTGLIRNISLTLVFYALVASWFIHLTIQNWGSPFVAGSFIILAGWSLILCFTAIHELVLITQIDYASPILELQKKLSHIRLVVLRHLRILVWILPFSFVFVILFFKLLFGIDIATNAPLDWIIWNNVICLVLFVPLSLWLYKKLNPKNVDKAWMQKALKGSGSQLTDALELLKEIREFEGTEEEKKWT